MVGSGYSVPSTGCALTAGCLVGTIAFGTYYSSTGALIASNAGGITGTYAAAVINKGFLEGGTIDLSCDTYTILHYLWFVSTDNLVGSGAQCTFVSNNGISVGYTTIYGTYSYTGS